MLPRLANPTSHLNCVLRQLLRETARCECRLGTDVHAGSQFDAVMGLEIIEHVDQPRQFLKTLGSLTKSNGALFISTINRTPRGYALAILGAEHLTGVVPVGTHDWNKFLTPGETTSCSACQADPASYDQH